MSDLTEDEINDLREVLKALIDPTRHTAINKLCDMALVGELMLEQRRIEDAAAPHIDDSWIINPDRMGGQFTLEELSRGWGSEGR